MGAKLDNDRKNSQVIDLEQSINYKSKRIIYPKTLKFNFIDSCRSEHSNYFKKKLKEDITFLTEEIF
jgi:glutaredoxin 2